MKNLVLMVMAFGLVACSGGAPGNSVVEDKVLNVYKSMIPANVEVKISESKCEPTSREKQYDCYVLFNIDGKDSDTRKYTFSQANGEWFITSGGYGFSRAKSEALGFKIER